MARRRFFVSEIRRGVAELTGDEAEHLVRVLRAEVDEVYEISDNQDLYLARITDARKSLVRFEVMEQLAVPAAGGRMTLLAALFKFDKFEWMVEKATELGVDEIVPVEAVRSERGLMQAAAKRRTRWERIGLEASQQARRVRLPVVAKAVQLKSALECNAAIRVFLDEDVTAMAMLDVLPVTSSAESDVALLVGPEGGWTETERKLAVDQGWAAASLGSTILRAETAGIAAMAVIRAWRRN